MRAPTTFFGLALLVAGMLGAANPPALDAARAAARAGDHDQVVALLAPLDNPSPAAQTLLGAAYLALDRGRDAWDLMAAAIDAPNATGELLVQAGRAALTQDRKDRARKAFERAHGMAPNGPAGRELGLLRSQEGDAEAALALLEAWLADHPDDSEAALGAGFAAIQLEQFEKAEELLVASGSREPRTRFLIANLQAQRGALEAARGTVADLVDHADAQVQRQAKGLLFQVAVALGDAAAVDQLLDGAPLPPAQAIRLGQAQEKRGDVAGALATFEPFRLRLLDVGDQPDAPGKGERVAMAREIARVLLVAGRPEEAVELLRLASRLAPDDAAVRRALRSAEAALER